MRLLVPPREKGSEKGCRASAKVRATAGMPGTAAAALNGLVPAGRRAPAAVGAGLAHRLLRPHCSHARLEDRKAGAWRRGCSSVDTHCGIVPTATSRRCLGEATAAVRPHKHLLTSERTRLTTTHPLGQRGAPHTPPQRCPFLGIIFLNPEKSKEEKWAEGQCGNKEPPTGSGS